MLDKESTMQNKNYKEDKQEMESLRETLHDGEIDKEVKQVKSIDPLTSLKLNLFSFFESRLEAIKEEDNFEKSIKDAILRKVEDDELSPTQLMQLYNNVKSQGSRSLEVLLDVFKPSQAGNVSPLVENKQQDGETHESSVGEFKELNPEQRDTLHKFAKMMTEAYDVQNNEQE